MSTYVVLVYGADPTLHGLTDADRAELLAQHQAFQEKHGASIKLGDGLQPVSTARSIQVGDGSLAVTDGPFVETKEVLGGFYAIEAADLDEAIAIASDVPAPFGGVEVRPVMVFT